MATPPLREPTLDPTPGTAGGGEDNATELDRSEESSTHSLYRAAIGPIGTSFYLPVFNRFEAADRGGISWNWPASLNTLNWLAFRKLWSAALAYAGAGVGLALLVFGIGRLVFRFSEPVEMALLVAYLAVMFVVPGLFANALLHADCRKRMARALAANTTLPEACAMLARQAPSRNRLIALAVANLLLLGAVVGAYVNFPAAGSLPKDTMSNLATMDPLGTRVAAPTPAASTAPAASAPASAPAVVTSAPASAPAPIPAPAAIASAPVSAPASQASAAKPAATAASAAKAAASAPKPAAPASTPVAKAISAPASAPVKAASAPIGRVAIGVVQVEPPRKVATPARPASATQPTASSPQEVGKVYRSEPAAALTTVTPATPVTPATSLAAKPVAAAKPQAASSAPKVESKHLVNVGLFALEANANNAMAKLKEASLPAYAEEIRSPTKGKLTRVRVGPFASQADAEAAVLKIRALGLDALLARP
ncbi:MAG: SPOR domain-containing protein [Rhodoferax sp.]|nr:SPOR domain-containing protein [Rhodoferax sp.]